VMSSILTLFLSCPLLLLLLPSNMVQIHSLKVS
jgi:hypothetical protein